jgi:DNA polymerase/3'-5' exonuclease PolX
MEALKRTSEELDEKIAQIELRLSESKEQGRLALKAKNKVKIAQHARAVKALQGQMSQLSAMKANLFERELAEEMAALTKNYTDAIAGALKHNRKGAFDVDKAIATVDSAQDHMEQLNEFSEAVRDATEASTSRDDEDDIEALFREEFSLDEPGGAAVPGAEFAALTPDQVGPPVARHPVVKSSGSQGPPPTETLLEARLNSITL